MFENWILKELGHKIIGKFKKTLFIWCNSIFDVFKTILLILSLNFKSDYLYDIIMNVPFYEY